MSNALAVAGSSAPSSASEQIPQRRALSYIGFTVLTRLLAFAALLVLAARLPQGGYGRFALLYQVGLFVSYQLSWPLIISGYRLAEQALAGFLRRATVAGATGALVGGLGGMLTIGGWSWTVAALSAFTATTASGAVAAGQAQALGRGRSYARWTALAASFFLVAALTSPSPGLVLALFALANLLPTFVLLSWLRSQTLTGTRTLGRPSPAVFLWGLCFNLTFVLALRLSDGHLGAHAADRFALGFTLLQAALFVPLQLMSLLQPRLIDQGPDYRERYAASQSIVAVLLMACGLALSGAAALLGWSSWLPAALLSLSLPGLSFGIISLQAYLLGQAGRAWRLLPGALLLLLALAVALGLAEGSGARLSLTALCTGWAVAATAAGLAQSLVCDRRWLPALVGAPLSGAVIIIVAGFVSGSLLLPLTGALLVVVARSAARAVTETLRLVAAQSN